MKKLVLVVLAGLFLTVFSSHVRAEDVAQQTDKSGDMMEHQMIMKSEKVRDPNKMMKMFHMMMVKNMVATNDGGVIVLVGDKLQKYDKNLVLQKETEIKIDEKQMQKMMPRCPMKNTEMKAKRNEKAEREEKAGMDTPPVVERE